MADFHFQPVYRQLLDLQRRLTAELRKNPFLDLNTRDPKIEAGDEAPTGETPDGSEPDPGPPSPPA